MVAKKGEELVRELQDIRKKLTEMKVPMHWYAVVLFLSVTALITWKCASSLL